MDPCPRCLPLVLDGSIPREALQPAIDGGQCRDCNSADAMHEAEPASTWLTERQGVAGTRQMNLRMPSAIHGDDRSQLGGAKTTYRLIREPVWGDEVEILDEETGEVVDVQREVLVEALYEAIPPVVQPCRSDEVGPHLAWLDEVLPLEQGAS